MRDDDSGNFHWIRETQRVCTASLDLGVYKHQYLHSYSQVTSSRLSTVEIHWPWLPPDLVQKGGWWDILWIYIYALKRLPTVSMVGSAEFIIPFVCRFKDWLSAQLSARLYTLAISAPREEGWLKGVKLYFWSFVDTQYLWACKHAAAKVDLNATNFQIAMLSCDLIELVH